MSSIGGYSLTTLGCAFGCACHPNFSSVVAETRVMAAMVSPKRPLSLSRDLRDAVQTTGPKQGAKPMEVYGFVGAISTLVGFVLFLMWAYLPEPWLHTMGITYYPNRYWAMAVPAYVLVSLVFVVALYSSLNSLATPAPWSLNSLFDESTRGPSSCAQALRATDRPIDAICDVPISTVNGLLFGATDR